MPTAFDLGGNRRRRCGCRVVFAAILGTGVGVFINCGKSLTGRVELVTPRDRGEIFGFQTALPSNAEAKQFAEPGAIQSLAAYQDRLARSLAALVNLLDPDVIVLGGGISNITSLYGGLTELIARHAFSDGIRTKVFRAAHGNSSGVRGAAWLWPINKP